LEETKKGAWNKVKIKQTIKKIEEEIEIFGGKDFDKRNEVDLTDKGDLTATLKYAKLSGYKLALKDVLSEIDEVENPYPKEVFPELNEQQLIDISITLKKVHGFPIDRLSAHISRNVFDNTKEELKKPIQEVLK